MEADLSVYTEEYKNYVAHFQPQRLMQPMSEWDEARITSWVVTGCAIVWLGSSLIVIILYLLSYWFN